MKKSNESSRRGLMQNWYVWLFPLIAAGVSGWLLVDYLKQSGPTIHIAFEDAMKIFDGLTLEMVDDRFDYGESRYLAYGVIDDAAYCLVFTIRNGRYRPISLRQAHAKEMRRHAPES